MGPDCAGAGRKVQPDKTTVATAAAADEYGVSETAFFLAVWNVDDAESVSATAAAEAPPKEVTDAERL